MTFPPDLAGAFEQATGEAALAARQISGGDINDAWAVELAGGRRAFVKTRAGAPAGEYATEAAGLRWLGEPRALDVPEVLGVHDPADDAPDARLLALQWVDAGSLSDHGRETLGRGLARLHAAGAPAFGAAPPGAPDPADGRGPPLRLGAVVLPNDPLQDWAEFYGECRLRPLAEMAHRGGALSDRGRQAVEDIVERLPDLCGPPEPPARLHGDLWSGNVLADRHGNPWLIDPAAYGGHREVDLAMLALFGEPGPRFLSAYDEVAPLANGHRERVELYQLLPLLVHAVLFGGSYGASAERAARRYAG